MEQFIGCDAHKKFSVFVAVNEKGVAVFIRINGQPQNLWRAVDQNGDVIDILVQPRRDRGAAERFLRRLPARPGKRTVLYLYRN